MLATFLRNLTLVHRLGLATGYRRWRRLFETPVAVPAPGPLVSIVVPVFRPASRAFRAMAASVRAQTYGHWELLLVDAGHPDGPLRRLMAAWAAADPRVRVVRLEANRGIAANTNAGLAQARGEWVGFLDHDDALAPEALAAAVSAAQASPDAEALYSDEDKLTPWLGRRVLPFLKPDWSPETLWGHHYACHFLVVRRPLGERLGWLRCGYEGAQDYDFFLRVTEATGRIVHVPRVLYHWRMGPRSTAGRPGAKAYAYDAARRALTEHFARRGLEVRVEEGTAPGTSRIRFPGGPEPLVSILVPNRDQADLLDRCLTSLLRITDYRNFEVIVGENGSVDPATFAVYDRHQADPRVRVAALPSGPPFNFARANNTLVRNEARGEVLLFLNNDTEVLEPGWLGELAARVQVPGLGAVGAKLVYPDGRLQHGGIAVGLAGFAGHPFKGSRPGARGYYSALAVDRNVSAVTGACLMVTREAFDRVGGFDEDFALAGNDVDLCLRLLQAGYRNLWTPWARLVHHESRTRGYEDTQEKQARFAAEKALFRRRWAAFLAQGDPFYPRGLTLDREDWSLARRLP